MAAAPVACVDARRDERLMGAGERDQLLEVLRRALGDVRGEIYKTGTTAYEIQLPSAKRYRPGYATAWQACPPSRFAKMMPGAFQSGATSWGWTPQSARGIGFIDSIAESLGSDAQYTLSQ